MKRATEFVTLALALALAATATASAGELMVHPTRVVLEGTARTAQIDLINSGTEPMTYRVSVINRRMTETGDFTKVDAPAAGEQFANDMIRFSPRQVVLQPGVAQAVRVQLRKPAELAEGEYRTHLLFQALPPGAPPAPEGDAPADGVDIQLTAIYSVSIPVIVRHGTTAASVSLGDLELRRSAAAAPALAVSIGRTGSRSVYGDLTVHLRPARGAEKVIARANGVAVYAPNAVRRVVLPLPALAAGIPAGDLRVTFSERPEQRQKATADAVLAVR
ncbi:MAG TPA: fimbria/pilus periplasmic chaperone [Thermoanaerobaculia bacterium]